MLSKSPLRYPGGKSRGISQILPLIPREVESVVSPFFGGGSVEIACADSMGIPVYGYDLFHPLVCFWRCEKESPSRLADAIEEFRPLDNDRFFELREEIMSESLDEYEVGARFFVLNRCSFSGTTLSGGRSPGFPRFNENSVAKVRNFVCDNLRWVRQMRFEDSIATHPDSFIFADPPYLIDDRLYGNRGDRHFQQEDHENLRDILMSRDHWLLCYNDCEEIRDLYRDYEIVSPEWSYGMSRGGSKELLILDHWASEMLAHQDSHIEQKKVAKTSSQTDKSKKESGGKHMMNDGVQFYTLDNGLSLIVIPDPHVHGVYCRVDVQVGSCDEQLDRDRGICHLLEHMVWRGTKDYDEDQIIRMMSGSGGYSNAMTSHHYSCYNGWTRTSNLGDMLAVLDSIIFRPEIDRDTLETEKVVVLEEIAKSESDPSDVAYDRAIKSLYPRHNFRHPILGTKTSVAGMKATRIREYMRSYHRPQAMILGLCGDLPDLDDWCEILHERAHGLSRKTRAANAIEIPRDFGKPIPILDEGSGEEEWDKISSSFIERMFPIESREMSKLERVSLGVLQRVMGGGEYSMMFTRIRRERGLSYLCGAFMSSTLDVGTLATYAYTRRQNVQEVEDITSDVVTRIVHGNFSDDTFRMAKNDALGGMERMMNAPSTMLGYYVGSQHDPDESRRMLPDETLRVLDGVTKKDVVAVANRVLTMPSSRYAILNKESASATHD